jgi:hypothetical protein
MNEKAHDSYSEKAVALSRIDIISCYCRSIVHMTSSCSSDDCVEDNLIENLQTGVCRLKEVDADRVITRVEHVVKANELKYDGMANNLLEGVVQPRDRTAKSLRRNSLGSYGGHLYSETSRSRWPEIGRPP